MSTHDPRYRGPLAWMAQNPVAANLLMLIFIVGGLIMSTRVKKELFPEFSLDIVSIEVPFPGASPAEVEQGIVRVIEEAVRASTGSRRSAPGPGRAWAG
ncbi:MAG: efflux RND transporter permease subunit [bacterium]